jgi:hypothetical protein
MTKIVHAPNPAPLRAVSYPDYGDQMDELWKGFEALLNGQPVPQSTLDMLARIKAVKAKYPKRKAT